MPQFCALFHAILQSWRPKGGAMAQWPPLNTPLDWVKKDGANANLVQYDWPNFTYPPFDYTLVVV